MDNEVIKVAAKEKTVKANMDSYSFMALEETKDVQVDINSLKEVAKVAGIITKRGGKNDKRKKNANHTQRKRGGIIH